MLIADVMESLFLVVVMFLVQYEYSPFLSGRWARVLEAVQLTSMSVMDLGMLRCHLGLVWVFI